jgi:hypothetical protein
VRRQTLASHYLSMQKQQKASPLLLCGKDWPQRLSSYLLPGYGYDGAPM